METFSVLLCILVTCSVWTVQVRSFKVSIDEEEQVEASGEAQALPGICWACKWTLKKVKKIIGQNTTAEKITSKLKDVCNEIGFLKSKCRKFIDSHLSVLVEELSTTDDVTTICVNLRACKPKEVLGIFLFQKDEELKHHIEVDELP